MTSTHQAGDEPVPGYRLAEFLGRGGFGDVWKAIAPGGAEVALKFISLGGKQGLKEFQALRLVKRIRHPNLLPLFAYWLRDSSNHLLDDADASLDELKRAVSAVAGPLDGTMIAPPKSPTDRPSELIIAMGLGEKDLFRRLEECRQEGLRGVPVGELLGYIEDAARAIDYLNSPRHMLGTGLGSIQHCDIKPHNIMIVGGSVQLCDFGLARMLGDVRKTATAAGTIAYVAPECLTRNEPSSSTDQYSLAVSYVELKTGKLPYASDNYSDVLNAVLKGGLDLSRLSAAERAVVRRATSLDPGKRYPSAVAMAHALRAAVEGGQLAETTPLPPLASRPRAGRGVLIAGLLLAALIAIAATWGLRAGRLWPEPAPRQEATAENNSSAPSTLRTPTAPPIATTPAPTAPAATTPAASPPPPNSAPAVVAPSVPQTSSAPAEIALRPASDDKIAEPRLAPPTSMEDAADRDAAMRLAEGKRLFENGDLSEAAEQFGNVIREAPRHAAEAYLQRGTCFLEMKNFDAADADLSRAIELDARDARAFSRRATSRLRQKKFDEAVADFTAAIKIKPDARDYASRSVVRLLQGNHDQAIADATAALELDPGSADAYFSRGQAYYDRGEPGQAIEDFTAALRHAPDNRIDAHLSRCSAAKLGGDEQLAKWDESIARDLQTLERKPDDTETAAGLAWLLATAPDARVRDGAEAVELATRACELSKWKSAPYLDTLAAAYAENGQFEPAVKWAAQAVGLAENVLQRSQFEARLKQYEAQRPYRQPSLSAKP